MAELDKKILKTQADFVQSVLEAHEKKNLDRVDMLVQNAIKQLKMSRFKPDQTTCISLVYLTKLNPRIFSQSNTIKDALKSLLRRDNGPTNIKGKSDIFLPVLAANILLASCDSNEIRSLVLNKIDQWLSSNQRISELIQHLIATICMKCQSDSQTISTLTEMRQHWLQYLRDNHDTYSFIPDDLCASIRSLLLDEKNADKLLTYLDFLTKHDGNILNLSKEIGRFINERPMTLEHLLVQPQGFQLGNTVTITDTTKLQQPTKQEQAKSAIIPKSEPMQVRIKEEPVNEINDIKPVKKETGQIPVTQIKTNIDSKKDNDAETNQINGQHEKVDSQQFRKYIPPLYLKLAEHEKPLSLDKNTLEAALSLLVMTSDNQNFRERHQELVFSWLVCGQDDKVELISIYEDFGLTKEYDIPDPLRLKLALSGNQFLIDLALQGASASQLMKLLIQNGTDIQTVGKILEKLEPDQDFELLRAELSDDLYFCAVIDYYAELGSSEAKDFLKRVEQTAYGP